MAYLLTVGQFFGTTNNKSIYQRLDAMVGKLSIQMITSIFNFNTIISTAERNNVLSHRAVEERPISPRGAMGRSSTAR